MVQETRLRLGNIRKIQEYTDSVPWMPASIQIKTSEYAWNSSIKIKILDYIYYLRPF